MKNKEDIKNDSLKNSIGNIKISRLLQNQFKVCDVTIFRNFL